MAYFINYIGRNYFTFQIQRIVPIVKNLYQSQKSILEGFLMALISKDVILQYRWCGRIEETSAFKELKNIQIVLLSAMIRVDGNYTLYQFEEEVKSVFKKCVQATNKSKVCISKLPFDFFEHFIKIFVLFIQKKGKKLGNATTDNGFDENSALAFDGENNNDEVKNADGLSDLKLDESTLEMLKTYDVSGDETVSKLDVD